MSTIKEIATLWSQGSEKEWNDCLEYYWTLIKPGNLSVEQEMESLVSSEVAAMPTEKFYDFLYNRYFFWKYTAPNRLATTRKNLERYKNENQMNKLAEIHKLIFSFNQQNIREGLKIAEQIYGLGIAGASGLLSLLFPKYFGTVDQFAVKALLQIKDLPQQNLLQNMKPEGLRLEDGVVLIEIMRKKAAQLNKTFKTDTWTPRKIDKVLWCIGR